MQTFPSPSVTPNVTPYGPVGLVVGTIAIGALTILLCGLVAGIVFGLATARLGFQGSLQAVAALRPAAGADDAFLIRIGILVSLIVYAALVFAIIILARVRAGAQWREIVALHAWHPFRGARLFWATAVVGFLYNVAVSALIARYYPASKDWIAIPKDPAWIVGFILLAVVFAPIAEEAMFRGWLFTSLRRSIGVTATIIVTSVLFALAHWEATHLYALAVLPVGLVLGIIRARTGTIAASMVFHAFYNGAACALLVAGF